MSETPRTIQTERKPWPMKWVVLLIAVYVLLQIGWIALHWDQIQAERESARQEAEQRERATPPTGVE